MLSFLFAVLAVLLDQFFKHWIALTLVGGGEKIVIPGILNLIYVQNSGAAFSILPNSRWLLVGISFVAMIVLIMILLRYNEGFWGTLGLAAVLGGTVGNLLDRAFNGYVVDMFRVTFMNFAIFNVADIFITLGALTFCIYFIVSSFKTGGAEKDRQISTSGERVDRPSREAGRDNSRGNDRDSDQDYPQDDGIDYEQLFYEDEQPAPLSDMRYEPEHDDTVLYEPASVKNDRYGPAQDYDARYAAEPGYDARYNAEQPAPGADGYYGPETEQPIYYAETEQAADDYAGIAQEQGEVFTSALDALGALEIELSDADLPGDYDIDKLLKEYGFENDGNRD